MITDISQVRANDRRGTRRLLAAVVLTLAATGVLCGTFLLKDHITPKRFGVVEQGRIYRSGQLSARLIKKILIKRNIAVIIDLTSNDPNNPDQQAEIKAAAESNVRILRFPLRGNGTGDVNNYAGAIAAIADLDKNKLPVLVHCAAGAQRTGGVIAAYRLLIQKKDPAFIIDEMKRYGWKPKSDSTLLAYLNDNMTELAKLLKQSGVIEEYPVPMPQLPQN